jgi:hypothetical protein
MKSNYEERKQARIERYSELSEKAENQSKQAFAEGQKISSFIPLGQPILVGHHSESRHRRDLNSIDNAMRKSIDLDKKADYYNQRAEAAENNNSISSDDPEATRKLKEKIAGIESSLALMKEANKVIKSKKLSDAGKVENLVKLSFTGSQALKLLQPDFCGRIGFASYVFQNSGANLRRLRLRLEGLEKAALETTTTKTISGVEIVDNVEENRLQLFFPGKPSEQVRKKLKEHGFHWSHTSGCWQRFRSNAANYQAEAILSEFKENS